MIKIQKSWIYVAAMAISLLWIIFNLFLMDLLVIRFPHNLTYDGGMHCYFECIKTYTLFYIISLPFYRMPPKHSLLKDIILVILLSLQLYFNYNEPGHLMVHMISDRCADDLRDTNNYLSGGLITIFSLKILAEAIRWYIAKKFTSRVITKHAMSIIAAVLIPISWLTTNDIFNELTFSTIQTVMFIALLICSFGVFWGMKFNETVVINSFRGIRIVNRGDTSNCFKKSIFIQLSVVISVVVVTEIVWICKIFF